MELFSEIYSRYYQVAELILEAAKNGQMTEQKMSQIVAAYGFGESTLFLLPKFFNGEYELFERKGEFFLPKVTYCSGYPLSSLQKSFLRAILDDPRLRLFLTKEQLLEVQTALKGVEPLFLWQDFYYFDRFIEGDPYESEEYAENFRMVLMALKEHKVLRLTYQSGHGNLIRGNFAPYRLQYSQKDDCFRLLCIQVKQEKIKQHFTINLARILEAAYALADFPKEEILEKIEHNNYSKEPVVIEISDERNALERCMLHFATYEKQTIQTQQAGIYHCKIFYQKEEETELLIRILSFGPVLRVLGPSAFLKQVKERVAKQIELCSHSLNYSGSSN